MKVIINNDKKNFKIAENNPLEEIINLCNKAVETQDCENAIQVAEMVLKTTSSLKDYSNDNPVYIKKGLKLIKN